MPVSRQVLPGEALSHGNLSAVSRIHFLTTCALQKHQSR